MIDQSMNYGELHISRTFRDHDLLLLQTYGAVRNDFDSFCTALLYRFGVLDIFIRPDQSLRSLSAPEPDSDMIEELLILLTQILTELPVDVSLLDKDNARQSKFGIRRELIHKLAFGPIAFSELHDTVYHASDISKVVEEIILDVSDSRDFASVGVAATATKRVLKPELWKEYDPCYYHYLPITHQKIQDSRPPISSPQPIVAAPPLAHASFRSLRSSALTSKAVFLPLLKKLTLAAATVRVGSEEYKHLSAGIRGGIGKMNIFSCVLHLLTLVIHIFDGLSDDDGIIHEAKSSRPVSSAKSIESSGGGSSAVTAMALTEEDVTNTSQKEKMRKELSDFFLRQESISKMFVDDYFLEPHVLGSLVDLQFALASDASEANTCNWLKW